LDTNVTNRRIFKLIIRISITSALLIWVFCQVDLQQFWKTIGTAKWQYLIAVWGLTVVIFWIQSIKMRLILKKQDCDVDIFTLFGASSVTALYGLVLPGILSTGAKWYILKKNTGKGKVVLSSMVYNQLSAMVVMTVFGLAALIVTNPTAKLITGSKNRWILPTLSGVFLVIIVLVSVLLLNRRTGGRVIAGIMYLLRPLPSGIYQKFQGMFDQIAIFQTAGIRFHLTMALFASIGTLVGGIGMYILAAKAANVATSIGIFMWLWPIHYVLRRIPISIANLGVRETTMVWLLSIYGVETSAAFLMSMILFSSIIFIAGIGAIYQIKWSVRMDQKIGPSEKNMIKSLF
jgi:uncharacterized membrane protein YbhN (UPF0104 family)